jgi:hypothetical protein
MSVTESTTEALTARVESAVHGKGGGRPAALTSVLHEIGQPAALTPLLMQIHDDASLAESVAQRSFQHQNGFVKLRLSTSSDYVLRLHVWTGDSPLQPEENVHDHRWSFASHMVCGHFRVKTYAMDHEGETALHCYRYRRHPVEDRFWFEDAGVRRFALTGDQIMLAGSTYFMEARIFHQLLFPIGVTTATLVVTLPRSRDWCYSCSERPRRPEMEHDMPHLAVDEVRRCAAAVLQACGR